MDSCESSTFTFDAWLRGRGATPLPSGTVFRVELSCTQNPGATLLAQNVSGITINGQTWDDPFTLELAQFHPVTTSSNPKMTSSNASCLGQIDGIRFVVRPGQNDLPEVVGTVSLDSVGVANFAMRSPMRE